MAGNSPGLHFPSGPANGPSLALRAVTVPIYQNGQVGADLHDLKVGPPLPLYGLSKASMDAIQQGKGLETADNLSAFKYLIMNSWRQVGEVSIDVDATGVAKASGSRVYRQNGESAYSSSKAEYGMGLDRLAALSQVRAGSFEPRTLGISSTSVIWLKADASKDDLIYTLQKAPVGLQPWTLYPVEALLRALRQPPLPKPPAPPATPTVRVAGLHFASDIPSARARAETEVGRQFPGSVIEEMTPIPNYAASVQAVAAGRGLGNATTLATSYCVYTTDGLSTAVRIILDATGPRTATPLFDASEVKEALKQISALSQVQAGSFEVRHLVLVPSGPYSPGGTTEMLWLKSSDQDVPDLFYSLGNYPRAIAGKGLITQIDFFNLVKKHLNIQPQTAMPPPVNLLTGKPLDPAPLPPGRQGRAPAAAVVHSPSVP